MVRRNIPSAMLIKFPFIVDINLGFWKVEEFFFFDNEDGLCLCPLSLSLDAWGKVSFECWLSCTTDDYLALLVSTCLTVHGL